MVGSQESLARKIAYSQTATSEGLVAAGVRSRGVERLSLIISQALLELGLVAPPVAAVAGDHDGPVAMIIPEGELTAPKATPKVGAMKKMPAWEESWNRFRSGQSLDAIAAQKGVLLDTVVTHLLDAFKQGRPVNVWLVAQQAAAVGSGPPCKAQWDVLVEGARREGIVVASSSSGGDLEAAAARTILQHVPRVGHLFEETVGKVVYTEEEQLERRVWYAALRWFKVFVATDFEVRWSEDAHPHEGGEGERKKTRPLSSVVFSEPPEHVQLLIDGSNSYKQQKRVCLR